jgi:hypothetical protein
MTEMGAVEFESPHLHHKEQVSDLLLCVPPARNGGVGTRWVHGSLGVEAVEAVGEVVQLLGEQVAVAVQRDRGGLVAQVVLHGLDAGALADQ